jgi:hypothetical protein
MATLSERVKALEAWKTAHISGHVLSGHTHPSTSHNHDSAYAKVAHTHAEPAPEPVPEPVPIPPLAGIQGYGRNAKGGQNPVHVRTETEFRAGFQPGNRVIVDVPELLLPNIFEIRTSGWTLDPNGCEFRGVPFVVANAQDFLILNTRLRGQDRVGTGDSITVKDGCRNFAISHVSATDATDGAIDITSDCHDGTVEWSILGGTGKALLVGYNTNRISIHHNLFFEGGDRQPQIGSSAISDPTDDLNADVRCNVIWDPDGGYRGTGISGAGQRANVVKNYYYLRSDRTGANIAIYTEIGGVAYVAGNFNKRGGSLATNSPAPEFPVPTEFRVTEEATALDAARAVLAGAGCRVGGLDSGDAARVAGIVL